MTLSREIDWCFSPSARLTRPDFYEFFFLNFLSQSPLAQLINLLASSLCFAFFIFAFSLFSFLIFLFFSLSFSFCI